MESLHPRMYLTHVLLSPKGHSPGWGHPGWSPEKNPQQYPGDAGTDEPDPVGGGLTFTCLGSPLPPGPAPSAPPSRPPVLGPPQGQQPPARRPPATGRTKQRSSQETSPRICATHMMEKKGMGTEENRSWEGAGNTEEYFLKRILIRKAIIVLGGKKKKKKKRAWEIHAVCPIGDQKQFLSNSLWEGDLAGAKKHVQENKCEGERQGPPFSPVPSAALPGLAQQPRAKRMDRRTGSHPWNQPGNIQSRCYRALRIFLSLENILETPMKETCFPCQLPGLRRDFCPPGSGRTWGHLKGQPS